MIPICQEKLFRFIYNLYITYMKLHYIVFYYLTRLDIVEKKIKKNFEKMLFEITEILPPKNKA